MTKEEVAQAIITQLENSGRKTIIETGFFKNYNNPDKIIWKSEDTGYVPDIKATIPNVGTNIYEIELTNKFVEDKWRLFSLFAKSHKGVLVLAIPESNLKKVQAIIESNNLKNVQFLYIST